MHSLVFLKHDVAKDKSKVRDLYIVTDVQDDSKISIQKVMHPFTENKSEINNRHKYRVKLGDVYLAPCQSKNIDVKENASQDTHENDLNDDDCKGRLDSNPLSQGSSATFIKKTNKFYTLPGEHDDDSDNINLLAVPSIAKVVNIEPNKDAVEEIAAVIKPTKTYERQRLNTFPKMLAKKMTARQVNRRRENVHQRWLTSRAKPPDKTEKIDDQAPKSSPISEPSSNADEEFGVIRGSHIPQDFEAECNDVENTLANIANQVALSAINENDEVFEDDE